MRNFIVVVLCMQYIIWAEIIVCKLVLVNMYIKPQINNYSPILVCNNKNIEIVLSNIRFIPFDNRAFILHVTLNKFIGSQTFIMLSQALTSK